MKSPKMQFDFSLGQGRAILQAAEDAAYERHDMAFAGLPEAIQAGLLKEAADQYDGAEDAAYERQMERNFTNYWEG